MKNKKVLIILTVVFALIAVVLAVFLLTDKNKNPDVQADATTQTSYAEGDNSLSYLEYPDMDEYFEERAEVISVLSVEDSADVLTLENVVEELKSRGFTNVEVTPVFTMNGGYLDENEASEQSGGKYPMYTSQYVTPSGEFWTISVVNNQFMATPVSYNLQSELTTSTIISESETITSYDNVDNRFFITKPYEDSVTVKIVDRIDAATLDSLTAEEIERL